MVHVVASAARPFGAGGRSSNCSARPEGSKPDSIQASWTGAAARSPFAATATAPAISLNSALPNRSTSPTCACALVMRLPLTKVPLEECRSVTVTRWPFASTSQARVGGGDGVVLDRDLALPPAADDGGASHLERDAFAAGERLQGECGGGLRPVHRRRRLTRLTSRPAGGLGPLPYARQATAHVLTDGPDRRAAAPGKHHGDDGRA